MAKSIMMQGTASNAGKSLIAARIMQENINMKKLYEILEKGV